MVCEQSRPAGEQSRSLELRYYRLVGPSVWKCTCRRAGLRLRRDTGGGSGFSGCLSAVNVSAFHSQYLLTHVHSSRMFLLTSNTLACLLHVFSLIFYLVSLRFFLFAVSVFLFSSDHLLHAPSVFPPVLTSSFTPPLHPSNVGGQQNNIQGVMVTGSPLPVVSSCYCPTAAWLLHSINRTHTGLITTAHCCARASIMGETLETRVHVKAGYLGKFVSEFHRDIQ